MHVYIFSNAVVEILEIAFFSNAGKILLLGQEEFRILIQSTLF